MSNDAFLRRLAERGERATKDSLRDKERAAKILEGCNPVQRRFLLDPSKKKSLRCPRRSGKSFAITSHGLELGERTPGKRILIVSLTLKSTKENFWSGAPGGIFTQNHAYGLNLKFNHTDLVWFHENGSRGRLAGAETRSDIEHLRGAAAEADIVFIDECKSFAPEHLNELIQDVIEPGLMTRDGILVLAGTPGLLPMGPFYEATCERSRIQGEEEGLLLPTCTPYEGEEVAEGWSLHTWTILDNLAAPKQWQRALRKKAERRWSDDHPSWRREYLGEWTTDTFDLVYAYAAARGVTSGYVQWSPVRSKGNPTGLPEDKGPWHLIMGLDFGYEDSCAAVMAAWSEQLQELRHVGEFKSNHITIDEFAEEIAELAGRYGQPEIVVADSSGKMLIETMNQRYGWGIIPAERKDKFDHIELLNSDFHAGRIKLLIGSELEREMLGLQWDLSKDTKALLAKTGKLKEDPSCPNHLCDAFLYLWRYAYHFWSTPIDPGPEKGSVSWFELQEKAAVERAVAKKRAEALDPHGFAELRKNDGRLGEPGWRQHTSRTWRN